MQSSCQHSGTFILSSFPEKIGICQKMPSFLSKIIWIVTWQALEGRSQTEYWHFGILQKKLSRTSRLVVTRATVLSNSTSFFITLFLYHHFVVIFLENQTQTAL